MMILVVTTFFHSHVTVDVFQVIVGILFPPFILLLEYRSREELQLMPQTLEEHQQDLKASSDSEGSDSDSDGRSTASNGSAGDVGASGSAKKHHRQHKVNTSSVRIKTIITSTVSQFEHHLLSHERHFCFFLVFSPKVQ